MHKIQGLPDPTSHFLVAKMIAGSRRNQDKADVRMPITRSVLRQLLKAAPVVVSNDYTSYMLQCMFSLAFHAFLRVGEMAASSKKGAVNVLQFSDVHAPKKISKQCVITLQKFKHSGAQGPQNIVLKRQKAADSKFCPVHLMRKYLKKRGKHPGPLFVLRNGQPYLRRNFDAALKQVLNFCGFSTALYKGHSFRIGAATEAAAKGYPDALIRNLGRWRTDAFRKYICIMPNSC